MGAGPADRREGPQPQARGRHVSNASGKQLCHTAQAEGTPTLRTAVPGLEGAGWGRGSTENSWHNSRDSLCLTEAGKYHDLGRMSPPQSTHLSPPETWLALAVGRDGLPAMRPLGGGAALSQTPDQELSRSVP